MTKPIFFNGREITPTDATFDYPTAGLKGWRIREDALGLKAIDPDASVVVRIEQEAAVFTVRQGGRHEVPMQVLDELVRRQRERVAEALSKETPCP